MQLRRRLLSAILLCLTVQASVAQREALFSAANAYNPVPSPDGKFVAYVQTGWNREHGLGGFGRGNLESEVLVATPDGKIVGHRKIDSFLGEWLPDSSAFVCYRDWRFGLAAADGWRQQETMPDISEIRTSTFAKAERVAFLFPLQRYVWIDRRPSKTFLQTPQGPIGEYEGGLPASDLIVPSPNGRYLAVAGTIAGNGFHLLVFDVQEKSWSDFGEMTIHPSSDWDYIKPSWNPWFSDSSRLTFLSNNALYVATPDGSRRDKIAKIENSGLPVPSPDRKHIAYVTFTPRPTRARPDLTFWGGATVWVIPSVGGKPSRATQSSEDTTYSLRWLDNSTLFFDRVSDVLFYAHARVWSVRLATKDIDDDNGDYHPVSTSKH